MFGEPAAARAVQLAHVGTERPITESLIISRCKVAVNAKTSQSIENDLTATLSNNPVRVSFFLIDKNKLPSIINRKPAVLIGIKCTVF